jgi:hypothetical protein
VRLSVASYRRLLAFMVIGSVFGIVCVLIAGAVGGPEVRLGVAVYAMLLTLLPAIASSLVLFDYSSQGGNMALPESGCSQWLLRMPIQSWKIVLVPIVLKTIWIMALWAVVQTGAKSLGVKSPPMFFAPGLFLSACMVWVMGVAWRPFRSGLRRFLLVMVSLPTFYVSFGLTFSASYVNESWRSTAIVASVFASIAFFVVAVWFLYRSVELARTHIGGLIPQEGKAISPSGENYVSQTYTNPVGALVAHDRIQNQPWVRKTILVAGLPAIVIISLLVPLKMYTAVMTIFGFFYLGAIAVCRSEFTSESSYDLPTYLGASPLKNSEIAWTRFVGQMWTALRVFLLVVFVFAGWSLWETNRSSWMDWAEQQASEVAADNALGIGIRYSLAIFIACGVFGVGRLAGCVWVGMAGRGWLNVAMSIAYALTLMASAGFAIVWFLQQPDWETAIASAWSFAETIPTIIAFGVMVKWIAVVAAFLALVRSGQATQAAAIRVVAIWLGITFVVAIALALLIPHPRATLLLCLSATAVAIPLARVLVLPISLAWNRHR